MAEYGILLPRHPDGSPVHGKVLWAALRAMSHTWLVKAGATLAKREAATQEAGKDFVRKAELSS